MNNKALDAIFTYNMISKGDSILVGFSGGADSVALLYFLYSNKQLLDISLSAVHLNHLLRGRDALADEEFSRKFCQKLKIPFTSKQVDISGLADKEGLSFEQVARRERYKLFNSIPADKIATAHTLSDSVETVLINLVRGTGINGLTGIPPVRDSIIRPLINSTRSEIEAYCKENSLDYVTDKTNFENDYTRNKIRNLVIPQLKEINPALEDSLLNLTNHLKNDADYLNGQAKATLKDIEKDNNYSITKVLQLHPAIRNRVIILILEKHELEVSTQRVDLILENLKNNSGGLSLSDKDTLQIKDGYFSIAKPLVLTPAFSLQVEKEQLISNKLLEVYPGKNFIITTLECKEIENIANVFPNRLKNLLDYDKIALLVNFRQRKPGDSFTQANRGVTKSVKKLFNESKLTPQQRSSIVFLEMENEIVWIEGFGASESCKVDKNTKLAIEIKNTK